MSEQLVADAKALILERGTIRSSAIAELLGWSVPNVHRLLAPSVESGELIACAVEAGGEKLIDYRHSVAGKGKAPFYDPSRVAPALKKPPTPPRATILLESTYGTERGPGPGPILTQRISIPLKEVKVTNTDKIVAALKQHGPMTTPQLRTYGIKAANLGSLCAQSVRYGTLKRLGGGPRASVWGLPGQVMSDASSAEPKVAKTKKAAGGGKPMRRKQRKKPITEIRRALATAESRAEGRRTEAARIVAGRFRPAIAHDGALLLTGAAMPGELNSAETRVLADFLARVDRSGARA